MPKRSEKRDTAKAEYIAKKKKGEEVSLRALAGELGVSYQTLRNWKAADKWEEALPKKKRGGQPGNQNSKGKRNAAGSHDGAPPGNKNAENLYTKKTGREKDEVAAWMDATSWWTGEEAKTNGFVDELVDDGEKTVVENRGGLLFVNSVNMNLPFDKAPKFVQNSVAAAPAASGFVNTPTPAEQPGNNSHKEDTNMANEIKTVDELRGAYPALVDQIEQAAALRATNAERQRIRDIEEMALPGSEQITNEAKYDKPMSASDYAKAAMKNAKEQGAAWLNTMQQGANASGVNSVGSAPAPTGGEKPDEFMDAIKGLGKKQ